MADQQESFRIVGGANPEEETKESESVIFFRNRPHYDRYREDDDDDDPEAVGTTSSFVYFSEDEDEDDSWGRNRRGPVPPYLKPHEQRGTATPGSQIIQPASFDISEASTIIVREDTKKKKKDEEFPYAYPETSAKHRKPPLRESVPVEFDQTVVVVQDPGSSSFVSARPPVVSSSSTTTTQLQQQQAVERSKIGSFIGGEGSFVDGKPTKRCGWVLLAVAALFILLGGGGGAAAVYYLLIRPEADSNDPSAGNSTLNTPQAPTVTPPPTPVAAPTSTATPSAIKPPPVATSTGMPVTGPRPSDVVTVLNEGSAEPVTYVATLGPTLSPIQTMTPQVDSKGSGTDLNNPRGEVAAGMPSPPAAEPTMIPVTPLPIPTNMPVTSSTLSPVAVSTGMPVAQNPQNIPSKFFVGGGGGGGATPITDFPVPMPSPTPSPDSDIEDALSDQAKKGNNPGIGMQETRDEQLLLRGQP